MKTEDLAALGHFAEALGVASSTVARCMVEGIDGQEEVSNTPHRIRLQQRIANVWACVELASGHFGLDENAIQQAAAIRLHQLRGECPAENAPGAPEPDAAEPVAAEPETFDFG